MTVVITGGTGVVGGAVLQRLVGSEDEVRALVRSRRGAARVAARGAVPVVGEVESLPSLVEAFHGADVVYHVAGRNELCPTDPSVLYRVNVDGSRNVVRAARVAGVRRLVYTSSAATIGEPRGTVGTEDTPHRGYHLSHYERSKYLAEQVVFAEADDLEVVVVNPSSVQGPGRGSGTGRLLINVLAGRLPVLVDTWISIVDIDDCADGHLRAAAQGRPGERYLLNSFTLRVADALSLAEIVAGLDLRVRFLPGWVARVGASAVEAVARATGRRPPVCREMVRTMVHGHRYDGSKAERELGLRYHTPEETLGRLIAWAREERLLPS